MRTKVNWSILGGDGTLSRTSRAPGRLIRATSIGRCKRKLSGQIEVVQRIVGEGSLAGQRRFAVVEHRREHQIGPVDPAVAVPGLVGQVVALLDPSRAPRGCGRW